MVVSILKELTCKSRHKKTVSRGKLIHLPPTADYSSLRLLELIPGLEERSDTPPTGQQPITGPQDGPPSLQAGYIFRCSGPQRLTSNWRSGHRVNTLQPFQQDQAWGSGSSEPVGSGAAAATNLEPD